MLISFKLPPIVNANCVYSINNIYVHEDEFVERGKKLLDIRVDLQSTLQHDCPSINFYRLVAQESSWLKKLYVYSGQRVDVDFLMGIFSTEVSEFFTPDVHPRRSMRLGYAGIIHEADWYNLDK